MYGRKSRYIGEVLGWYRGDDAGDLKRSELDEFIDKNEPWLVIGIPSRHPVVVTQHLERHSVTSDQHMKKLMSLRECLHMMMQRYMRQHFADCYWQHEHPGGHASWREPTMRKFTKRINYVLCTRTCVQMENIQKMQSESSEYCTEGNSYTHFSLKFGIN